MKKISNPKLLAKITIITIILGFILSIISNIIFYGNHIPIINFIFSLFTSANSYILIYLLVVLNKKEKDMKKLNLGLIICIIITTIIFIVRQIISINQIYSIALSVANVSNFQIWFNLITNTLYMILEIVMIYGIMKKPYKLLMMSLITLSFIKIIPSIISLISYINVTAYIEYNPILPIILNVLSLINGIICSCSFILFLYLYGKSINERSLKKER